MSDITGRLTQNGSRWVEGSEDSREECDIVYASPDEKQKPYKSD